MIDAAAKKSYEQLLQTHLEDYQDLYCSVDVDLGGTPYTDIPTDQQMAAYREGKSDPYLEELLLQYGRYLLTASSRKGTLCVQHQSADELLELLRYQSGRAV